MQLHHGVILLWEKLQNLESECKILCDKMHTFKQEHALQLAMQFWWAILSLTGSDLEYYPLLVQHESATNDALIAKRAMSANSAFLLAICRLSKLVTAFHCGFLATAEDTIVAIEKVKILYSFTGASWSISSTRDLPSMLWHQLQGSGDILVVIDKRVIKSEGL